MNHPDTRYQDLRLSCPASLYTLPPAPGRVWGGHGGGAWCVTVTLPTVTSVAIPGARSA